MGKVAQVVFESSESGDDLPVDSERRDLIRDPFFGTWHYFKDRLAQSLQSGSFRLLKIRQVAIDFVTGHVSDFRDWSAQGQEARYLRLPQNAILTWPSLHLDPDLTVATMASNAGPTQEDYGQGNDSGLVEEHRDNSDLGSFLMQIGMFSLELTPWEPTEGCLRNAGLSHLPGSED